MKLRRLLRGIDGVVVHGSKEIEISGLTAHSNLVAPGNLFIAKKGKSYDGSRFIPEVAKAGAAAVLTDVYDPFTPVTQLIASDVLSLEPLLAAEYYRRPSEALRLIGITGTNGKTTCALLLQYLLEKWEGEKVGLISTIAWETGKSCMPASFTTPDVITNQKLLREMVYSGCRSAVMEVSSHGLEQRRVEGLAFDMALFTNLTREHLDYHENMERYCLAKRRLFEMLPKRGIAIVNGDDPFSLKMIEGSKGQSVTYGLGDHNLVAEKIKCGKNSVEFVVRWDGKEIPFKVPLIGKFNVINLLAVIAAGSMLGMEIEEIAYFLKTPPTIPGRMAPVKNSLGFSIFVDYAHTPDALKNALETLKESCTGKVVVVFGCGGERDKGKRQEMGTIAEKYSDLVVVTSDNPRREDPNVITLEILAGCTREHRVELNRRKAIEEAIRTCNPGDTLLIAGRGHESVQIDAAGSHPFDDAQVADEICSSMGKA